MNIIIIDDEIAFLNTFLLNITDESEFRYTIFVKRPLAAIQYLNENKVDAVFLNINMSSINGIDLAQKLISKNTTLNVIFVSDCEQDEASIFKSFAGNLIGFCYKPYTTQSLHFYLSLIRKKIDSGKEIYFKTFPSFDLFIDGKRVDFCRTKAKEMLALLVDRHGSTVSMGETMANLWSDKNVELAKRLYRDAVCQLRLVLNENRICGLVTFAHARLSLNCEKAKADLWDFLEDKNYTGYDGEYMTSYDWSFERQCFLDHLAETRNV